MLSSCLGYGYLTLFVWKALRALGFHVPSGVAVGAVNDLQRIFWSGGFEVSSAGGGCIVCLFIESASASERARPAAQFTDAVQGNCAPPRTHDVRRVSSGCVAERHGGLTAESSGGF